MRTMLVVGLALALTACATVSKQGAKYETGSFPRIGELTTVRVGQVIASRYDYLAEMTAVLRVDVPGSFWAGRNGLVAGDSLVSAVSAGAQVFCAVPIQVSTPCLRDVDADGRFDHAAVFNAYGLLVNDREIPPAEYRAANQTIRDGFKYELIYQGVDNGVVRIAYREFTDNLARPAFSQDLTYTLAANGETRATFRDVTMQIKAANNDSIEYTVTSGFGGDQ